MSLKSSFRALLEAHLLSKKSWVAHQGAPNSPGIIDFGNSVTSGTAPADGYLCWRVETSGVESPWFSLESADVSQNLMAAPFVGGGSVSFIPVRSGRPWRLTLGTCRLDHIWFIPLVGGAV